MSRKVLLIAALALVLAITSGGCFGKSWKVSFAFPSNYSDWLQQDWGGSIASVPGLGVKLNAWALSSPVAFDQDFTITVNLTLNTAEDEEVYFGILIGDGVGFYPTNYLYSVFSDIGREGSEDWTVHERSAIQHGKVDNSTLPTLIRKSINIWRLEKTGSNIKVYMNLYKLADFDLTVCTAAFYNISLYSEQLGGDIIFNSVKVDYKGSII